MKEIIFYRTASGHCPVEDFLISLQAKVRQKVAYVLLIVKEFDPVPVGYFKKLINTDEIWEVRVKFAGNIYRLLGFFDGKGRIIVTNGFVKKTQKTPRKEILLSEQRKREYLSREDTNGRS